jgi:hypothetical protein
VVERVVARRGSPNSGPPMKASDSVPCSIPQSSRKVVGNLSNGSRCLWRSVYWGPRVGKGGHSLPCWLSQQNGVIGHLGYVRLQIADCKLQIGREGENWTSKASNSQFAIFNLQSRSRPRVSSAASLASCKTGPSALKYVAYAHLAWSDPQDKVEGGLRCSSPRQQGASPIYR